MNRRQFSQATLGAAVLTRSGKAAKAAASERKDWAREHLKGMGNALMPSFAPDFLSLDEDGIRHDVRQSIRHGFSSCTVSATGANAAQRKRMMEIVREESQGKIETAVIVGGSADAAIEALAAAAKAGCSHGLVMYPESANPQTEDEVYAHFRKVADSTSMGILLYGSPVESLRRFHPSGIPLGVYDRLADHPQVIGMKLTHPMSAAVAFEICERLSGRLIMGPVNLDLVPVLAKHYRNVQWSAQWIVEAVQSPEKPYAAEFIKLAASGHMPDAMKVYWQMQGLVKAIYDLQAPLLLHGSHPWVHMKYFQWATGGNGGLLPLKPGRYLPVLDAASRQLIKDNFRKAGIEPSGQSEEEFVVGRAAWAKGVRASTLSDKPLYT
jgi:4-hydroxy-tetrahydrodipicolinate synthase